MVIFVKSVQRAKTLNALLNECNFPSVCIYAGMPQEKRLEVYKNFKDNQVGAGRPPTHNTQPAVASTAGTRKPNTTCGPVFLSAPARQQHCLFTPSGVWERRRARPRSSKGCGSC